METLKKIFPLSFKYTKDVPNLIIGILIQLVVGIIAGVLIGILAKVPVVSLEDYTEEDTVIRSADAEIERNGLLLGNEEILCAMNDELNSQFLAGISQKDGIFSGNALISGENFEKLFSDMEKVILKITAEMRSGCADARPLKYDGKDPCTYCEYRSVCRYISKA